MVVLALVAWWAGLGTVMKYAGFAGVAAYSCVILTAPVWGPRVAALGAGRAFRILMGAGAVGLALTMLLVYPRADARSPEAGSDDDDALNVAAEALLVGQHPYAQPTYLGNPIAPLPGAIVLAMPFVVVAGSSAYQALVWVPALAAVVRRLASRERTLVVWGTVALSPAVAASIATGSSAFVNGIYVSLATLAVYRWPGLLTAAFLGLTLSSRALFWPILPLLVIAVHDRFGGRVAIRVAAAAVVAFAAVTLPVWLADTDGFTPLETRRQLTVGGRVSPFVGGAMYVVALIVAVRSLSRTVELKSLLRAGLIAVGIPVFGITTIAITTFGIGVYGYYAYMLEALPFAALYAAAFDRLLPPDPRLPTRQAMNRGTNRIRTQTEPEGGDDDRATR